MNSLMTEEQYYSQTNFEEEIKPMMTEEQYYSQTNNYDETSIMTEQEYNSNYNNIDNMMKEIVNQEGYIKDSLKKEVKKKKNNSSLDNNNDINIFINNAGHEKNKNMSNQDTIHTNETDMNRINKLKLKNKANKYKDIPIKKNNSLYPQTLNNLMHEKKNNKNNKICPIDINQPWSNYKTGDNEPMGYNI